MNLELVEQIVSVLGEFPVSEIAVEFESTRVHVCRPIASLPSSSTVLIETSEAGSGVAESAAPSLEITADAVPEISRVLTAPMVGIFYHTEPPMPLAAEIKRGQVVGSIESMKLMNDVTAEEGGRITDILIEDGAPVEYGQTLFRLAAL